MNSILNRLFWTFIATLAFCLLMAIGVTWHVYAITRAVDATLIGGVK